MRCTFTTQSSDPRDPGGETNWGISKRSYPQLDIKALTRDDARAIYRRDFWAAVGNAHPAISFQVFDFSVNSGIGTALRKLQQANRSLYPHKPHRVIVAELSDGGYEPPFTPGAARWKTALQMNAASL